VLAAMQEAADCAAAGSVPLLVSHHKCAGVHNWGRSVETLALVDELKKHQPVALDCYPYTAGASVLEVDLVDGEIEVLITASESHPTMAGRYLADIAAGWQCSEREAAARLLPAKACYFQMHEDDVRRVLAHPEAMVGSDGLPGAAHPHPRLWGTFPRVLGHYAREQQLFSLETAVHKMTGLAAHYFRLKERGVIRLGAWADLVLFDPQQINDRATYETPCQPADGIELVLVNGQVVVQHKQHQPVRAGQLLRR